MSVIGVVSMKGGAGKTSITANLATAMATKLGPERVSVIDLDPQNGLQWHFGFNGMQTSGVCEESLKGESWRTATTASEFGVACLPYGEASESEREAFEALLQKQPNWVANQIKQAKLGDDAVVLIDTHQAPPFI